MKKTLSLILALVMCLSMYACAGGESDAQNTDTPGIETSDAATEAPVDTEEVKPNYEEIVPAELQGIWGDTSTEGILALYTFKDHNIKTYVVNHGAGAASLLEGTYTIEDGKIKYDFGNSTGNSNFTYENEVFVLMNANGVEMKKLSAADMMEYLVQEESSSNRNDITCLADLIISYYADTAESSVALEKKESVVAAIKAEGEAALQKLNTTYDKVQKLTWYQHKNQPEYVDVTCYVYPYIGRTDDGNTWLRVVLNYTDAKTDAGWLFFDEVIFSVDGENTAKSFNSNEIVRDNDTEVWETADFEPDASDIQLLKDIANSTETIVRFQGDEYYDDHIVTDKEKAAILDVLAAYDYLENYAE